MTESALLVSRAGPVLTLSFNRPSRRNALTVDLALALEKALVEADRDPTVQAVVLTGEGGHFCSGIDLVAVLEGTDPSPDSRGQLVHRVLTGALHPALLALWNCRKPTVGVLPGATVGIGLSYALACDLRVIAQDGYLSTQFGARGLFPDGGCVYQLQRLCGLGRALEFSLRPQLRVAGTEAVALGLASSAVAANALRAVGDSLAQELAKGAPLVQAAVKHTARGDEFVRVLAAEVEAVLRCLKSRDAEEGLVAFMEKRPPIFRGE